MALTFLSADVEGRVGDLTLRARLQTGEGPLVLVGPNGAGKSSVLKMLLGALRPTRGEIRISDHVLFDAAGGIDLPVERRRLGYVPQRYGLFPHLTVRENVAYGVPEPSVNVRRAVADDVLASVGARELADRAASALSGGEAQRVALARALASRPQALLLDEPLAALDVSRRQEVRAFLAATLAHWRLPTVVVTHDLDDAKALGSTIVVLEAGSVTQAGTLADLERAPSTPFVDHFVRGQRPAPEA